MDVIAENVRKIRIPSPGDLIFKDECVYSFDTPESEDGLFICLNTFLGFGKEYALFHHERTGNAVFLNIKRIKKLKPNVSNDGPTKEPENKVIRLAIGVEGGFNPDANADKYEIEQVNKLVVLPSFQEVSLDRINDLPLVVNSSVEAILAAESAERRSDIDALEGTWDGEKRFISKHAENLVQLNPGRRIPPSNWKCEKCDKRDNLWLNLTDGSILCGRKFFDGTGGNNHAVEHYEEVRHPLAVKLGTITSKNGMTNGDVYSYDEDAMVEDPFLAKHLEHFGINLSSLEKTEKSMIELEIDYNQRIGEWTTLTESNRELRPLFGPGYTGMINLGNSCYLNSTMQVLFSLNEFSNEYYHHARDIFSSTVSHPTNDFNVQMAKLATGLLSGKYSTPPQDGASEVANGIKPVMFKNLIGSGHPEFSTKRQQDAQEFYLHLINLIDRNSRVSKGTVSKSCPSEKSPCPSEKSPCPSEKSSCPSKCGNVPKSCPSKCLSFQIEDRIQCTTSSKVTYTTRTEYILPLPINMTSGINTEDVEAYEKELGSEGKSHDAGAVHSPVRPKIPLLACFEAFAASELIDDFYSTAINDKTRALKTSRFKTFPDYLMIQMKKFTLAEDWVPKKLDVQIILPKDDILDLSMYRSSGLQPGEETLPETCPRTGDSIGEDSPPVVVKEPDAGQVAQLVEMGFSDDACKRALHNTGNAGLESAINWLFEHQSDADFNHPFILPSGGGSSSSSSSGGGQSSSPAAASSFQVDANSLESVVAMGLPEAHARKALKETNNNVERAIDWIFSHQDELSNEMMDTDEVTPSGAVGGAVGGAVAKESLESQRSQSPVHDGPGRYKLKAFISHMGSNTMCGHYVCHILKDGAWVIFNDEKVALSETPPKELAYLYLYERIKE